MFQLIRSSILLFILVFLSNSLLALDGDSLTHEYILENSNKYLKYEDPQKGTANARIWLEKGVLIMEILTPAYNIHGVETAPNLRSENEKERVQMAKKRFLNSPDQYFVFRPGNFCSMMSLAYRLEQDNEGPKQAKPGSKVWRHFDVRSEMIFLCKQASPERITVDLFRAFPRLKELNVQYIANNSDIRRVTLTPNKPVVELTRTSINKFK